MKLLLLTTTVVATICCVSAGKTQRLLAAMNAGLLPGLANGVNPGIMAGGLNLPIVAGGRAGFIGQPQFAQVSPQFVPGALAYALPAQVPNVYPVPAVNALPFMGFPQMAPVYPPQQQQMGIADGAMAQQPPPQLDPLRRFRRQIMKQVDNIKNTVDTQIAAPTDAVATTHCEGDHHHEAN